jgi:hypothetical protein
MEILTEPEDKYIEDIISVIKETEDYKKWTKIAF